MKNITFNPQSKNFRSRYKAHLLRCKAWYESGHTLYNSVDYFFNINKKYSPTPNLDVDFNILHGVYYEMRRDI